MGRVTETAETAETPQPYAGRVVIVTGGSRGLGRAMTWGFARAGAHVVVAGRRQETCDAVCSALARAGLHEPLAVATQVADWESCDRLVARAHERFGRIDVLVNNAGSSPHYPSLGELSRELVDKVMGLNLLGPMRLAIRAAEVMGATGGGAILNISSAAAVQPESYDLPYAIAKGGLHTMTAGLSKALAPHVRVNTIMAGPFDTDVSAAWNDETRARIESRVALGRVGRPEEIVGAALHLCSDDASFTTGAVLKIDGGMAWAAS